MYVDSVQDQTKSDKIRTICIPRGLERKRGTNRNVGELIRLLWISRINKRDGMDNDEAIEDYYASVDPADAQEYFYKRGAFARVL